MPHAVPKGKPVEKFARNAPRAMPGQNREPKMRSAASAIPVGGQTGDTFLCAKAINNPSLAAPK
jgi:hypothetical protein